MGGGSKESVESEEQTDDQHFIEKNVLRKSHSDNHGRKKMLGDILSDVVGRPKGFVALCHLSSQQRWILPACCPESSAEQKMKQQIFFGNDILKEGPGYFLYFAHILH